MGQTKVDHACPLSVPLQQPGSPSSPTSSSSSQRPPEWVVSEEERQLQRRVRFGMNASWTVNVVLLVAKVWSARGVRLRKSGLPRGGVPSGAGMLHAMPSLPA